MILFGRIKLFFSEKSCNQKHKNIDSEYLENSDKGLFFTILILCNTLLREGFKKNN